MDKANSTSRANFSASDKGVSRFIRALLTVGLAALLLTICGAERTMAVELKAGDTVPEFKLPYATKDTVDMSGFGSSDVKGKRYMLAFYPADWSGGCTTEMCTFRDAITQFENLHIQVLPVSADLVFSHREWAKHLNLPFKLLADQTRDFGRKVGVYMEDKGMFRRTVIVVGPDGKVEYAKYDYSVKDDTDYNALKAFLQKTTTAAK